MNDSTTLTVDFAGEVVQLTPGQVFRIGREGDLALTDNPYLHREFLTLEFLDLMWWVLNVGGRLPAYLADDRGLMRSTLAPGARTPLVFADTVLTFGAGRTTYELLLSLPGATGYRAAPARDETDGDTTIGATSFTSSQLLVILALAEPVLRRAGTGASSLPSAVDAARRLGWTQTRFNRKVDNVCDKLIRSGVTGLRGVDGAGAANRRLRLVEYAVSTLLVTAADLAQLDAEAAASTRTTQ